MRVKLRITGTKARFIRKSLQNENCFPQCSSPLRRSLRSNHSPIHLALDNHAKAGLCQFTSCILVLQVQPHKKLPKSGPYCFLCRSIRYPRSVNGHLNCRSAGRPQIPEFGNLKIKLLSCGANILPIRELFRLQDPAFNPPPQKKRRFCGFYRPLQLLPISKT